MFILLFIFLAIYQSKKDEHFLIVQTVVVRSGECFREFGWFVQFLAKLPGYCEFLSILIQIRYSKYSHVLSSHAYYVYRVTVYPSLYLFSCQKRARTRDLFRSPLYPNLCHNRASTDLSDKIQGLGRN